MSAPNAPERRSEREIFFEAIEKATPNERAAYLDGACGGDALVRRRVEALLAKHFQQDNFMKEPAVEACPIAAPAASNSEAVGTVIDRYKLREKIGEGGCGVVYVADQEEPVRRRVALKLIKPGMDTKSVLARFEAERQALAMMDHPSIAKVLDAGATETGRPYFVMELVRGIKITDYCDQNKLPTEQRLELFIKVCQAVQHAHQKAIIHRDLKPSNILVTLNDGVAVPKIIDFGIAKATEGRLTDLTVYTELNQLIGTPAYMSPEQALMTSTDIDTRSDIYSLGVLLYELLVGRTPFDPKELAQAGLDEMRRTIREKEPVRPSTRLSTLAQADLDTAAKARGTEAPRLRSLLRGDLDWIVMQCLEKDRNRRYETANGLASDVKRFLSNEPVVARPPSAAYRFQKWVRRNKLAFAAAGAIATVLVVGVVVSTSQAVRATRAERRAQEEALRARQAEKVAQEKSAVAEEQRQRATAQERDSHLKTYASDMNLVQRELEMNNLSRAVSLLDRHRPTNTSEIDLRGWEWRYLWNQCQSDAESVFCKTKSYVHALSLSYDGAWLAVAMSGGVSVRDVATGQEIAFLPARGLTVRAAFSPREPLLAYSDVPYQGSSSTNYSVHIWNNQTQQIVRTLPLSYDCYGLAFSADGRTLVTSQQSPEWRAPLGGVIALWQVSDGSLVTNYPVSLFGRGVGTPFAAAADLSVAAYASEDAKVSVINLATGHELWEPKKATDDYLEALAFSPDATILASGECVDPVIRLWEVASGRELGRLEGHSAGIHQLLFLPDGKTLASASYDQTIRLWDVTAPANRREPRVLRGHKGSVFALALLTNKTTLVSGSDDRSVCFWNISAKPRDRKRTTLPMPVGAWAFTPDSKSIVTGENYPSKMDRVARWSQATDFQEMELLFHYGTNCESGWFSTDGRWTAFSYEDGTVRVWDLESRSKTCQFKAQSQSVTLRAFTAQGKKLMLTHEPDNSLHEWDLETGQETRFWPSAPGRYTGAFSPDGNWYLTSILNPDTKSVTSLTELNTGRTTNLNLGWYAGAAFSADSKLFALAGWSREVLIWDTATLKQIARFTGFPFAVWSAAFSPDMKRVATANDGRETIKLWDLKSGEQLVTLEWQGSMPEGLGFSPDGNVLVANNARSVLTLWRAPSWAEIEAAEKAQVASGPFRSR